MASKLKKKTEYHHGDLRNALVEAAARLVAERGIGALSLREVAREAGVSHAAPYHHFSDKSALLAAVAEEGFKRFDLFQVRATRGKRNPQEKLRALGRSYVSFAIANPDFFRIMFRQDFVEPSLYPSLDAVSNRTFERLVNSVREIQKVSGKGKEDPIPAAIQAWAVVHGIASLWLDGKLNKIPDTKKTILRIIHRACTKLIEN